jgi:hypothetical protein
MRYMGANLHNIVIYEVTFHPQYRELPSDDIFPLYTKGPFYLLFLAVVLLWEGIVGTGWSGLRIGTGGGHL